MLNANLRPDIALEAEGLRLSKLMKKILLILLKAEGDPKFLSSRDVAITMRLELMMEIGEISEEEMYEILRKMPAEVSKLQFVKLIKPAAVESRVSFNEIFYYVKGSVEVSFTRSLKRLVELGLIKFRRQRRIYVYRLTEKGRAIAEKIKREIQPIIQEYQQFI